MENMKTTLFFCVIACTLLMSSCAIYQPQAVSIPLLEEKGDFSADVGFSSDVAASANIAYAFTNHFGGQIHATYGTDNYYAQLALGYYTKLSEKGRMGIYGGYGYGYGYVKPGEGYLRYQGSYHLPFVQYNYGRVHNARGHIEYGVGVKLGLSIMERTDDVAIMGNDPIYDPLNPLGEPDKYRELAGILEPLVFFRTGGEHLKFQLQVGFCLAANKNNGFMFGTYSYYPFNISMGISYKINFNRDKKTIK